MKFKTQYIRDKKVTWLSFNECILVTECVENGIPKSMCETPVTQTSVE